MCVQVSDGIQNGVTFCQQELRARAKSCYLEGFIFDILLETASKMGVMIPQIASLVAKAAAVESREQSGIVESEFR